jgi:CheY-like chemotaxis protein
LLGGEIFLESELNRGSTFSFSFPFKTTPLAQHEPKKIDATSDSNLLNKNILIVEDDFYNSEYLKEILSGVGLNILHAEDGKEAIEIAMSQPIDIVLMDIRLPDMNGYAATRQIQQYKPHLKIIAHTAYAAQDEKQKAIDAGCCDYISKPTKQDTLLSMLNKHLL